MSSGALNSSCVTARSAELSLVTLTTLDASLPTGIAPKFTWVGFTVTRTGSTAASLNVFYSVGGTAANGTDYTALPGSVTIPAGMSSATITVSVIDDTLVEGPETVIVTLIATADYLVGTPNTDTVSLADND